MYRYGLKLIYVYDRRRSRPLKPDNPIAVNYLINVLINNVTYYFYARRNARRIHSVYKRISYKRAGNKVCGFNTVSMDISCQIGTQSIPSEMKTPFCVLAIMKTSKLPN